LPTAAEIMQMPQLLHDEEREVFTSVGLYEGSLSGIDEEHGARVRRLRIGQSLSHAGTPPAGRGDVSPVTPICRSDSTQPSAGKPLPELMF